MVVLLAAVGCEGAVSGSSSGHSGTCRSFNYTGTCEGSYKKIKGTYGHGIEVEGVPSDTPVDVEVTVSVREGGLRLSVTDPDGKSTSVEIKPGSTGTLVGVSTVDTWEEFDIKFQALAEEATDISYKIEYQVRS